MPEMPDLYPLIALLSLAYGAVALGTVAALVARWILRRTGRGRRHSLSASETASCALLPLMALAALAVAAAVQSPTALLHHAVHAQWHNWAERLHTIPILHGTLHTTNLVLLAAVLVGVSRAVFAASQVYAFSRTMARLASGPAKVGGATVYPFPSSGFYCLTVGIFRPNVYVSEGLLARLTPQETAAMLAHEAAHTERRDGLVGAVLTVFYRLFSLPGGALLYDDWVAATERDCDARAARWVGDPCDVAAALVTVAKLSRENAPLVSAALCFSAPDAAGEEVEARVRALLALADTAQQGAVRNPWVPACISGAGIAAVIALYPYLSHFVELLVYH